MLERIMRIFLTNYFLLQFRPFSARKADTVNSTENDLIGGKILLITRKKSLCILLIAYFLHFWPA